MLFRSGRAVVLVGGEHLGLIPPIQVGGQDCLQGIPAAFGVRCRPCGGGVAGRGSVGGGVVPPDRCDIGRGKGRFQNG